MRNIDGVEFVWHLTKHLPSFTSIFLIMWSHFFSCFMHIFFVTKYYLFINVGITIRSTSKNWGMIENVPDLGRVKNISSSSKWPDKERLFLECFRLLIDSIERLGGSVDTSKWYQQWMTFIPCRDIIHPQFPHKGKPILPITSSRKVPPKKKNKKESNKLL